MKILMVSIFVPDPIAAHTFYTETLGFISKLFQPEANLAIVVSPEDPDGTALLLELNENPVSKKYQTDIYNLNIPVMTFGVADIQREYERLLSRGVIFRGAPQGISYGTLTLFEDTCGNLLQLYQG